MVVALVALDGRTAAALRRRGVADSKKFAGRRDAMRELERHIRARAKFIGLRIVTPSEIDERRRRSELNELEREVAAKLITEAQATLIGQGIRATRIIADGERIFAALRTKFDGFESHDKADEKHAAVAAASIVAKVARDLQFAQIRERYESEFGQIGGGGYDNDVTRRWLRSYAERYGCLPDEARRSWPHDYLTDLLTDAPTRADAPKRAVRAPPLT